MKREPFYVGGNVNWCSYYVFKLEASSGLLVVVNEMNSLKKEKKFQVLFVLPYN